MLEWNHVNILAVKMVMTLQLPDIFYPLNALDTLHMHNIKYKGRQGCGNSNIVLMSSEQSESR